MRVEAVPAPPNAHSFFESFFQAGLPDSFREYVIGDCAFALDLDVLGRGLAAVGNLFVLDALPFVE